MLQCLRLSVAYDEIYALDAVNLTVRDGEVMAVMGPSGCGKTTLLRAVAGLQSLDVGTITWDGRDLRDTPPHLRGFGFMLQDYALFPHLNVKGNVEFGLRMQDLNHRHRSSVVGSILETVGLAGYESRRISELSGGEQQRVALARTLAPSPRLILLDEPIGALDRSLREELTTEMRSIFSHVGVTALYVTHDRDEAFAIADTVAVMDSGRLVRKGTPQELWKDPRAGFVAKMLGFGSPIAAIVADGWADIGWARIESGLPPGEHEIIIPPHAIRVAADGPNVGTVTECTFRSGAYSVEFEAGGSQLTTITHRRCEEQNQITFHIDPGEVVALRQSR